MGRDDEPDLDDVLKETPDASDPDAATVVPIEPRDKGRTWVARSPRYTYRVDVEIDVGVLSVPAEVRDIGLTGMFVYCDPVLRMDTEVSVAIPLPVGGKIRLSGKVVRTLEGTGMGIHFAPPGPAVQRRLDALVTALEQTVEQEELTYGSPDDTGFAILEE